MRADIDKRGKGRSEPALSFLRPLKGVAALRKDHVLNEVRTVAEKTGLSVYLVGGVIRNVALKRPLAPDYDFALLGDVKGFSDSVASRFGTSAFLLDEKAPIYRAVIKRDGLSTTLDFSPVKDGEIVKDLEGRDFTVNAMAVDLDALFKEKRPRVVDPCGGIEDAEKKVIRMTSGDVLESDPLRCLRAVRLAQQYGLRIEKGTLARMRESSYLLKGTSAERVRDELVFIFQANGSARSVKALYDTGVIDAVLPEIKGWADVDGYNLLAHSLKTLDEAERLVSGISGISGRTFPGVHLKMRERFGSLEGAVRRAALFKIAAFLHDIGKPLVISREGGRLRFMGHDREGSRLIKDILRRLKFSRKAVNELSGLVKNHHRVFMLAGLDERSFRAKAHLFRAAGGDSGVDLLCLALADARATRGGEDPTLCALVKEMLVFYYDVYARKRPKPLLNGDDIMRIFGVPEGRIVGTVMEKISEGVESGAVRNRKEAVDYVRKWLEVRKGGG